MWGQLQRGDSESAFREGVRGQRRHFVPTASGWVVSPRLTAGGLGSSLASITFQLCYLAVFLF